MNHYCVHKLIFEPSIHAKPAGYQRPTPRQRAAASRPKSRANWKDDDSSPAEFPAPLVLPEDDLAWEPQDPQSLKDWINLEERNAVTEERNVIYLAAPPVIHKDLGFMSSWSAPDLQDGDASPPHPSAEALAEYLSAFYHGLRVKFLPTTLCFEPWTTTKSKSKTPRYIGLKSSSSSTRIQTRPSKDKIFPRQLNLNDLLDAAIDMLPSDAYALLLLVEQDIFEDADDDFACGRAYGGSRIAVVSSARYNPILDDRQNVERVHAWPASHCEEYMRTLCPEPWSKRKNAAQTHIAVTAMSAALSAHQSLPLPADPEALTALWLSRVCRTAGHELGHCFGMAHCAYYACSMQGTASISEDARQPPYLCPVDVEKLLSATGAGMVERYRALLAFCTDHGDAHMFVAFGAWLGERLKKVE